MARYRGERIEQRSDGRWIIPEMTPGSFRTESAAKTWIDRVFESSFGGGLLLRPTRRRRRRTRSNPVSNTTLYWVLGGAGALGVVGLIWYFTKPKTTTDNKNQNQTDTGKTLTTATDSIAYDPGRPPPLGTNPKGAHLKPSVQVSWVDEHGNPIKPNNAA